VIVPDAASLDLADGPFTLEAWVNRNDTAAGWHDIMQKGANAFQFALFDSFGSLAKDNVATIAQTTTTISDTTNWHHVVATKSGSAVKLYIDGVDRTSAVANQTLANTGTALYFAAKNGTSEFLSADLDELAIYNQVLPVATVLDHYRAGAGTG
jgi:Concanavalin A-like lectin/glucanases superfamily